MGSGLFISRARLITEQSPHGALTLTQPCTNYERNRIYQSHFPVSVARPCRDGYVRHFIAVLSALASAYPRLTAALVQPSSDARVGIFGVFYHSQLLPGLQLPSRSVQRLGDNSNTTATLYALFRLNTRLSLQLELSFAYRFPHSRGGAVPAFVSYLHLTRKTITEGA